MRAIGLDIGSSSIKGGLLNTDTGTIEGVRSRPFPNSLTGEVLEFEVHPQQIVEAARAVLNELLATSGPVRSVWVCCQMGGVILCDESGRAVSNYISWRDQRLLDRHPSGQGTWFDVLQSRIGEEDLSRIGRELKPGGALGLLFWLAETGALPVKAMQAMGLGEFVLSQLCQYPAKTERTSALGTLDLLTRQWHQPLFDWLGFGHLKWPELIDVSEVAGMLPTSHGPVPCHPAVGDHQAALFGAGIREGELSVNVSTGSQVSLLTKTLQLGDYQTRPCFGGFLNTITHLPAGRSLNALVDLLTELPRAEGLTLKDPWGTIARCVEATRETDLDLSLTFFAGSLGDHGRMENIKLENLTLGHLFRAAFQNIADNSAVAAARLSSTSTWTSMVVSGGLPQKLPALLGEIAARFPCPTRTVAVAEETLQGLLELARAPWTTSAASG